MDINLRALADVMWFVLSSLSYMMWFVVFYSCSGNSFLRSAVSDLAIYVALLGDVFFLEQSSKWYGLVCRSSSLTQLQDRSWRVPSWPRVLSPSTTLRKQSMKSPCEE